MDVVELFLFAITAQCFCLDFEVLIFFFVVFYLSKLGSSPASCKDRNFEVLATNYSDRRKRKLAEALYIRDQKPTLNKQKESYKLKLFA